MRYLSSQICDNKYQTAVDPRCAAAGGFVAGLGADALATVDRPPCVRSSPGCQHAKATNEGGEDVEGQEWPAPARRGASSAQSLLIQGELSVFADARWPQC